MIPNDDTPPRQPGEDEPLEHDADDVLDFIDKTVARITDADVDEHLRKVLNQAGYSRTDPPPRSNVMGFRKGPGMTLRIFTAKALEGILTGESNDNVTDLIDAAILMSSAEHRCERLWQEQIAEDAQHEADQIVAEAREKSDEALSQAAKIVREAREQAARIISEASSKADQILENARLKRSEILEEVYLRRLHISEDAYRQQPQVFSDALKDIIEAVQTPSTQSHVLPGALAEMMRLAEPTVLPVCWAITAIAGAGDITALQRLADHAGGEVAPTQQAAAISAGLLVEYLAQIPQAYGPEVTIPGLSGAFITHHSAPANYTRENPPKHETGKMLAWQPGVTVSWTTDGVYRSNAAKTEPGYEFPIPGVKRIIALPSGYLQKGERPENPDFVLDENVTCAIQLKRSFLGFSQSNELTQPGEAQSASAISGIPQRVSPAEPVER
jgi:hypothetical protein